MCEALRDLMKEEIQEERQEAADIVAIAMIKNAMKTLGLDAINAMKSLGVSEKDQIRYAAKIKKENGAAFGPPCCFCSNLFPFTRSG